MIIKYLKKMVPTTAALILKNKELLSPPTIKLSFLLLLGVLIALLNVLEILMIVKIKKKKKIYEILLLSLSLSDLMFGMSNYIHFFILFKVWFYKSEPYKCNLYFILLFYHIINFPFIVHSS